MTKREINACPCEVNWSLYCSSRDTRNRKVMAAKQSWDYYQCNRCQTVQIDAYHDVSEVYATEKVPTHYSPKHFIVRLAHGLLGDPLNRLLNRSQFNHCRVLDVGCSNGQKLYDFFTKGTKEVYGVEFSSEKLAVAKRYMPEGQFYLGSLGEADFPKNYFDYVMADNVMEHIKSPDQFLRELLQYVRPGGKLVIMVPHGKSFSIKRLKHNSVNIWPPFHINLFTKKYFKIHFPDLRCQFKCRTHYFMFRKSLLRSGYHRWVATLLAFLLLPFAQEELVALVEKK